jgi:hypothetical protein
LIPEKQVGHFLYIQSYTLDEILKVKGLKSCIKQKDLAKLLWLPVAPQQKYFLEDNEEFLVLEHLGEKGDDNYGLSKGAVVSVHKYRVLFCETEFKGTP